MRLDVCFTNTKILESNSKRFSLTGLDWMKCTFHRCVCMCVCVCVLCSHIFCLGKYQYVYMYAHIIMTMRLTTSFPKIYFTVYWCVCVCVCVTSWKSSLCNCSPASVVCYDISLVNIRCWKVSTLLCDVSSARCALRCVSLVSRLNGTNVLFIGGCVCVRLCMP